MANSGSAERSDYRGYGQACDLCRTKKRRCQPTGQGHCVSCDREGVSCQSVRRERRPRRSGIVGSPSQSASPRSPQTSQARPTSKRWDPNRYSSQSSLHSPPTTSHANHHSSSTTTVPGDTVIDTELDAFGDLLSASYQPHGSLHNVAHQQQQTSQWDAVDRSASAGPSRNHVESRTYDAAASQFVLSVCGPSSRAEVDESLISIFFVWQANAHNTVSERLFRRDMQREPYGPFCSAALVYALCAQASRVTSASDQGRVYAERAQALCMAALNDPPALTTIQALLELAGRELALGQGSKGWLLSGMALRMVTDMGLHYDVKRSIDPHLSQEERDRLEVRIRVFWSAYCWDKFYALTMGRQVNLPFPHPDPHHSTLVTLRELPSIATPVNNDPLSEILEPKGCPLWTPLPSDGQEPFHYIPQPLHSGETFQATCLLFREIEEIIRGLYQSMSTDTDVTVDRVWMDWMAERLTRWRSDVAPGILLDTAYLPATSPPPHVLSVNILYRTAWILLKRPRGESRTTEAEVDEAQQLCALRSAEIHALFRLHQRAFGLRNLTYLMAYMAYVSATVDVNEALHPDTLRAEAGTTRLTFILQILTQASIHTPGIQRSISQLRRRAASKTAGFHPTSTTGRISVRTTAHPSLHGGALETRATSPEYSGPSTSLTADLRENGVDVQALDLEALFANLLPDTSVQATWAFPPDTQSDNTLGDENMWDWFATS